jgi:hypothetical protein
MKSVADYVWEHGKLSQTIDQPDAYTGARVFIQTRGTNITLQKDE